MPTSHTESVFGFAIDRDGLLELAAVLARAIVIGGLGRIGALVARIGIDPIHGLAGFRGFHCLLLCSSRVFAVGVVERVTGRAPGEAAEQHTGCDTGRATTQRSGKQAATGGTDRRTRRGLGPLTAAAAPASISYPIELGWPRSCIFDRLAFYWARAFGGAWLRNLQVSELQQDFELLKEQFDDGLCGKRSAHRFRGGYSAEVAPRCATGSQRPKKGEDRSWITYRWCQRLGVEPGGLHQVFNLLLV